MNYYGYSKAELEVEYSPSSMVGGDINPYLAAYSALSAAQRVQMSVHENLQYGPDEAHVLDFFPAATPNAPLHVFIHGGYWQALSHRDSASMAGDIVNSGQSFATLNYTIAPVGRLGQMARECRDALIWLAGSADELGFDPARLTLSGHSAGAHLVATVLSLYGDDLRRAGLTVTDAILVSGVFDLEPIAETSVNDALHLTPAEISELSPMALLPRDVQNVRVTVAERDTTEFVRQSRAYAEHLRKNGQAVTFDLQRGLHHFDIILFSSTFQPITAVPEAEDT
ncbi:MAG: alpha/beta hydrolase [Paracoccaceae bacterium]